MVTDPPTVEVTEHDDAEHDEHDPLDCLLVMRHHLHEADRSHFGDEYDAVQRLADDLVSVYVDCLTVWSEIHERCDAHTSPAAAVLYTLTDKLLRALSSDDDANAEGAGSEATS